MPMRFPPAMVLSFAALGGVGALLCSWWLGGEPDGAQAPARPGPVAAQAVFGPGLLAPRQADFQPATDAAFSLTDDGDLVVDPALLDFFQQHTSPAAWNSTEQDLRGRLSGKALEQALEIANNYRRYVGDYDSLLAAQNLGGTADLARLHAWAQQRHLLRQRIFGNAVALAWFDNDEANFNTALNELEQRASGMMDQQSPTDPRYGPSAEDTRRMAAAHEAQLQQVVRKAMRPLAPPVPGN